MVTVIRKMDMVTKVQTLHKIVCILHHTFWKDINPIILSQTMGK